MNDLLADTCCESYFDVDSAFDYAWLAFVGCLFGGSLWQALLM